MKPTLTSKTKRLLAILSSFFILCICCAGLGVWGGGTASRSIVWDAEEAQTVGQEIVGYTAPPGYTELMGLRIPDSKSVYLVDDPTDPQVLIFITQIPERAGVSEAEVEQQIQTMLQRFAFQTPEMTFERRETRPVNGQAVDLIYRTGADAAGISYRQLTVFFPGNEGQVLLIAQGPEEAWDQIAIEALLDSFH